MRPPAHPSTPCTHTLTHTPLQDSHSLYMVMEVVQGGEFFTYLQVQGPRAGPPCTEEEGAM